MTPKLLVSSFLQTLNIALFLETLKFSVWYRILVTYYIMIIYWLLKQKESVRTILQICSIDYMVSMWCYEYIFSFQYILEELSAFLASDVINQKLRTAIKIKLRSLNYRHLMTASRWCDRRSSESEIFYFYF